MRRVPRMGLLPPPPSMSRFKVRVTGFILLALWGGYHILDLQRTSPAIPVPYEDFCDLELEGERVAVRGYLNLRTSTTGCTTQGIGGPTTRCTAWLWPDPDSATVAASRSDTPAHAPVSERDLGSATRVVSMWYGSGPNEITEFRPGREAYNKSGTFPSLVHDADTTRVDPLDLVEVRGELGVVEEAGGRGLACYIYADTLRVAQAAPEGGWWGAYERYEESLQVRVDSPPDESGSLD